MPSFIKSVAIAAFASLASAQYSNGTQPSAVTVAGWSYLGCEVATAATGALIDSSASMTVERCLAAVGAYSYARIQGNNCYGASSINGTSPVSEASCNTRCPGNAAEACGGSAAASRKRQSAGTTVSVYARRAPIVAGSIYTTFITNVYVDYCPVCVGGTTSVSYMSLATVTACGCASQSVPTIAYTTVTTVCPVNGATSTLTLTVPSGVTPGTATSATVYAPTTTVVACSTCPAQSVATIGTATVTVPAGYVATTVAYCPGCAAGTGSVGVPAVPATVVANPPAANSGAANSGGANSGAASSPAAGGNTGATTTAGGRIPQYTGAADSLKVGSGVLAGAIAIAALL